ncbi:hypothetical protein CTI12_AA063000 [Artemisia annua]|uniref:Uncharacterized protein n=1 Tax=Artemisia annua TaxID=35608 RepID=A0A2U1PL70_ARTAN|nr:hypothetical protein CTI12_AA063000 [Artemisia annua]
MDQISGSCYLKYEPDEWIYPLDSGILFAPLNKEESKSWLEFTHNFGWQRDDYVKKGDEENIYEAQVTDVRFCPNNYGFSFFLTLEALEENVAGVYKATVLCHGDDGRRSLIKFTRSTRKVIGTKLKWMSKLILENFVYESVKEEEKAIKEKLRELRCNAKKGEKRSKVSPEYIRLIKEYKDVKGFYRVYDELAHLVKPITWKIKNSNPGDWFIPNKMTGLQPRSNKHSCAGYDYFNSLTVFSPYL